MRPAIRPTHVAALALAALAGLALPWRAAARQSSVFLGEASVVLGHSSERGWNWDGAASQTNSVGFEYLGRFSDDAGDFLTCDLQARMSYDPARPDDEPWALEIHSAWAEYKLALGRHLRVGHFEPAFGLERALDTHGTLLQTLAEESVGMKHDWGAAYRAGTGTVDWEAAAQLGSGMGLERRDSSFLLTWRAASPVSENPRYGVSGLMGRVLESMGMRTVPKPLYEDDAVPKTMVGVDAEWDAGLLTFAGEAVVGKMDGHDVLGALVQAAFPVPAMERLLLEAQGRLWTETPGAPDAAAFSSGLCASYRVTSGWTLRVALLHDGNGEAMSEETRAVFQAYYVGGIR